MRLSLYATVLAALFFAACSSTDEPIPVDNKGKVIGFSATAPKESRAAPTTTTSLDSFLVYAYTESEILMDGVVVSRKNGSWDYSPKVYWPSTPVNFYAISPDIRDSVSVPHTQVIKGLTYGSTDLLYAVNMNQFERAAPVPLNFRHAMSRVAVNLSSTSNKHQVKVYYVLLRNIYLQGDFTMPHQTTMRSDTTALGTWSNLTTFKDAMIFYFDTATEGVMSLTPTPVDVTDGGLDASFFVPQELVPFKFANGGIFSGGYIEVCCEILDKTTGDVVWPTANTPQYLLVNSPKCGRMLFPLATTNVSSWEQGYSYNYNIVINNSYSLDAIEFQPGVDNYTTVDAY